MKLSRYDIDRMCREHIILYCGDIIGDFRCITLISRLHHKNMVYRIEKRYGISLLVKVFLQAPAVEKRVISELIINEIYKNNSLSTFDIVRFNHFILINDLFVYGIGVRPWIKGCSFSDIFTQNPDGFFKFYFPHMRKICTEIWTCNTYPYIIDVVYSLYNQCKTTFDEVFSFFKSAEAAKIAHIYKSILPTYSEMYLINGDFSLHEFVGLSNGRIAVIDWEELSIGDPVIDVANLFSSMLQNNKSKIPTRFLLEYWLSQFHVRNLEAFYYYLVERVTIICYVLKIKKINMGLFILQKSVVLYILCVTCLLVKVI